MNDTEPETPDELGAGSSEPGTQTTPEPGAGSLEPGERTVPGPGVQAAAEGSPQDAAQPEGPLEAGLFWPPPPPSVPRRLHPAASLAIDVGVGLGALIPLVFVIGFAVLLHLLGHGSLSSMVPIVAVFFAVAAMVRAIWSRMNPWIEGLFISLGASLPLLLIAATGAGQPLRILAFVVALAAVCGVGAQMTRFLKTGRAPLAAATGVAFIVLVAVATKYTPMPAMPVPGLQTMDTPAPSLTLAMLDGNPVALDSLRGRVVVLDFWGTWCAPCMAEMPSVLRVHRKYQANRDVVFFAVNAGMEGDDAEKVRTTAREKHIDIALALDRPAARVFGVRMLPTLIVIDRGGHIRVENSGYNSGENLEEELSGQIDRLLASGAPESAKTSSR